MTAHWSADSLGLAAMSGGFPWLLGTGAQGNCLALAGLQPDPLQTVRDAACGGLDRFDDGVAHTIHCGQHGSGKWRGFSQ